MESLSTGNDLASPNSASAAPRTSRQFLDLQADRILALLTDSPGLSRAQVAKALGLELQLTGRLLARLVDGGTLTMTGRNKGARYSARIG